MVRDSHPAFWFVPNFGPVCTPAQPIRYYVTTTPTPQPPKKEEDEKEDIWALRIEDGLCPPGTSFVCVNNKCWCDSNEDAVLLAEILRTRDSHDVIVGDQSQQAADVGDVTRPSVLTFLLGLDAQAMEYTIKALAVLNKRILLFRNAESIQDAINILNTPAWSLGPL